VVVALGIALTSLVLQAVVLVVSQSHLFADGAFYLYSILTTEAPLGPDFGRHFAHVVTQWPAVVGIQMGLADVDRLSYLLGVGLYLPALVGIACCAWIVRRNVEWVLFPLLAAAAVTSNSSFFVVSESHLLVALFWPLLFLLVFDRCWSWRAFAAAAVLALPTLRCYESMIFFGPVLAVTVGWRSMTARNRLESVGFAVLASYFVAGTAIAAGGVLHPQLPENYSQFRNSLVFFRDHLGHWHWLGLTSMPAAAAVSLSLATGLKHRGWLALMLVMIGGAAVIAALVPVYHPMSVAPLLHYRARILNAYVPPLLALVLFVTLRRRPPGETWRFAFSLVAVLTIAQLTWHVLAVREWRNYRRLFRYEVANNRGLVPFDRSRLSNTSVHGHPIAAMNWDWTMPTVSIFLAPRGEVRALIDNPPKGYWQPFSPSEREQLPNLARYGINFDQYVAAIGPPRSPGEEERTMGEQSPAGRSKGGRE
jgi:hypothetical protein